jgi:hypothetical protein
MSSSAMIAAEQHASCLVVPPSQRMAGHPLELPQGHRGEGARKLAGPHIPSSLTKLEQAVRRAHAAYERFGGVLCGRSAPREGA